MSTAPALPVWRQPMREQMRLAFRRLSLPVGVFGVGLLILSHYISIGPNRTGSLPISEYPIIAVLKTGSVPAKGELVGLRPGPNRLYDQDAMFVKRLTGVPGDTVTYDGSAFYINGVLVATTKARAKNGMMLAPTMPGVIPECHYFVSTEHPDGYDSRYTDIGLVSCEQIVGPAYALP